VPYPVSEVTGEIPALQPEETDPGFLQGKKILVVDDTEINLVLIEAMFDKWNVTIDKARDGIQGLNLVKMGKYNVILSDVNMPKMNGIEMTKKIRGLSDPDKASTPVIILTANILQDEVERFQPAGVTDYLMKPFLMGDLLRVVRKNLA
jgi:CheY-like chemotaxis protein